MDYTKLLFALQVRQEATRRINDEIPEHFSVREKDQYLQDNLAAAIYDVVEEAMATAKEIEHIK